MGTSKKKADVRRRRAARAIAKPAVTVTINGRTLPVVGATIMGQAAGTWVYDDQDDRVDAAQQMMSWYQSTAASVAAWSLRVGDAARAAEQVDNPLNRVRYPQCPTPADCPYQPGTPEWKTWTRRLMDRQTGDSAATRAATAVADARLAVLREQMSSAPAARAADVDRVMAEVADARGLPDTPEIDNPWEQQPSIYSMLFGSGYGYISAPAGCTCPLCTGQWPAFTAPRGGITFINQQTQQMKTAAASLGAAAQAAADATSKLAAAFGLDDDTAAALFPGGTFVRLAGGQLDLGVIPGDPDHIEVTDLRSSLQKIRAQRGGRRCEHGEPRSRCRYCSGVRR